MSARPARRAAALAAVVVGCGCSFSSLSSEAQLRLQTIEFFAGELERDYPFFDGRREGWRAQVQRLREAAVAEPSTVAFYQSLAGVLGELRDPHISLTIPLRRLQRSEGGFGTSLEQLEGFALVTIGRDVHVAAWPDGSAPVAPDHLHGAAATLPQLARVEGFPVVRPLLQHLLRGEAGTVADLELRWSDGTLSHHGLRRPAGPVDALVMHGELRRPPRLAELRRARPGRSARIRSSTFDPDDAPGGPTIEQAIAAVDAVVDRVLDEPDLVLDLRGNPGGRAELMSAVVGRFLTEDTAMVAGSVVREWLFGLFQSEGFETWPVVVRQPAFAGRLVVLVDASTASAAEHFARLLQGTGRALVVGERTAGAEAAVVEVEGPEGSTMRFGARPIADRPGVNVQGRGVLPDVVVARRLADYRALGVEQAAAAWERRITAAAEAALRRLR